MVRDNRLSLNIPHFQLQLYSCHAGGISVFDSIGPAPGLDLMVVVSFVPAQKR